MAEDLDGNGIPDSIQRDPVVVPEPVDLFGDPTDVGLPGITAPIEEPAPIGSPAPDVRDAEMEQDVVLNKARTANKAADAVDGYIRD